MDSTGWPCVELGDVVGLRLSSVDKKILPGEQMVQLCNYSDVYNHRVLRGDMEYMKATATKREIRNCQLKVGDVIITKDSETPDDIGVPAVVGEEVADLVCGYHLAILRPFRYALHGMYLHYSLSSSHAKRQFQMYANGITRFGLRARDIERLRILLPPLPEQRKIAAILSSVDDAIEKTQAVIEQVQVVKRGLMQQLLTRGLPGGHTRFKQTEIGEIPEEWEVVSLEALCSHIVDCLHRTPKYTDNGYPAIRTSDLVAGRLLLNKAKKVSRETYVEQIVRLEPIPGDVLYSREGTFGKAAPVPVGVKLCISQRMMHFRARPGVDASFLMWLLNSPIVYAQAVDSVGGSTVGHVNIRSIRRFIVPMPGQEEQMQMSSVLNSVLRFETSSEKALLGYQRAKSALMSILLTGELRVIPDKETA